MKRPVVDTSWTESTEWKPKTYENLQTGQLSQET